ncbi:hypothetical protein [Zhongshania sp. BJYM1]|uniref:hypothetical protein n=1 Tax=Zhongshania aquatica TaxID=2965069 RepID=UPI0022B437FC|nr:hypothetical protein [Marortus sp. BJYM1]
MDKLATTSSINAPAPHGDGSWYHDLVQPSWLLTPLKSDKWCLEERVAGYSKSAYVVNWWRDGADVDFLGRRRYWVEKAKQVAYWYMESDATDCNRTTTLALICRELLSFFLWLAFERNVASLESVNESDIKVYERHLSERNIGRSTVTVRRTHLSIRF